MADGVQFQSATLATPPAGELIATDDAGAAGQVQIVKLAVSADGSATAIPADANGLQVKASSLPLPTGASTAALQTQPGVDIGDVTVNNAAGASAVNVQDGGNSLTVDGSVTANAGTNLNTSALALEAGGNLAAAAVSLAVLDNIVSGSEAQVDIVAALPAGNNNIGDVDIASSALPTGAATEATLATRALEAGGNLAAAAASLSVLDDWDETNRAAVNIIAGQVGVQGGSGTTNALTQRVVLATDVALPAGTNAIGKLAANSGVDIGDVDVTSLPALPAGTNNIGDVDVLSLPAIPAGNNNIGDVDVASSALPTGASTLAEQQTQTTALQLIDDTVFTDDTTTFTPATTKGIAMGGAVDDDSTDAADEGDLVVARFTKERKQRVVAALDSAAMQSGNDQVTPKFAVIAASSSGDNTLVSGVGSKKIRVLNYVLMSNGTVNAKFQSSTGGDITGLLYLIANTGASSGYAPTGHFETVAGEDLQLNLSAAIAVGGHLSYIEVD